MRFGSNDAIITDMKNQLVILLSIIAIQACQISGMDREYSIVSIVQEAIESMDEPASIAALKKYVSETGTVQKLCEIYKTLDEDKSTPLHHAVCYYDKNQKKLKENISILKWLINQGASVTIKEDIEGCTPLHTALSPEVVDCLVKAGAPVNAIQEDGLTPLHYAVRCGRTSVAQALLERGAFVDARTHHKETPLFFAHDLATGQLLLAYHAKIDAVDSRGCKPIHAIAGESDDHRLLGLLVKAGCNINEVSPNGVTPLYLAVQNPVQSIIQFCLDQGVQVRKLIGTDNDPLSSLADGLIDRKVYKTASPHTVEYNQFQTYFNCLGLLVARVFEEDPPYAAHIFRDRLDQSFLHWAVLLNQEMLVPKLLDAGADVAHMSKIKETPLMLAERLKRVRIREILTNHSVKPVMPIAVDTNIENLVTAINGMVVSNMTIDAAVDKELRKLTKRCVLC
jgi:ankyrin repeat protein